MLFLPMIILNAIIVYLCYQFLPLQALCNQKFHEEEISNLVCFGNTAQLWLFVALAILLLNSAYLFISAACGVPFFISGNQNHYEISRNCPEKQEEGENFLIPSSTVTKVEMTEESPL